MDKQPVSYTHLDVYKRQAFSSLYGAPHHAIPSYYDLPPKTEPLENSDHAPHIVSLASAKAERPSVVSIIS